MNLTSLSTAGVAALTASLLILNACGGGGGGGGSDSGGVGGGGGDDGSGTGTGVLRLALTDVPACGYDEVNVTIERIRIHQSPTAEDSASGWSEIVLNPAKRVNLLDLTNGVLEELGSTALPAGRYSQMRLLLGSNTAGNATANSVVLSGGTERALTTPSAQQSGLKMNVNIDVTADQVADLVLDFDACKSVVRAGRSGRYLLKPVVSVLPRVTTPGLAVEGYVAPALGGGTTSVSLQQNGTVARATVPDPNNGRFLLSPVPSGNYDLVISANGRVTAVMTGVPVTPTGVTRINPASTPIDPPSSTTSSVSGNATTNGSTTIPDATVRALQTIGTSTIEVISRRVDAETGAYSFSLPVGAPVLATYPADATAPSFTVDSSASGQYTLEAAVPGQAPQTVPVDLSAGDANASFSFAP